ncbi:hypothetical protein [Candidatus Phytoplasma oryzae]|nr:hypothetical protein PIE28_02035 [Candidatus Phytoplasma oryzae]
MLEQLFDEKKFKYIILFYFIIFSVIVLYFQKCNLKSDQILKDNYFELISKVMPQFEEINFSNKKIEEQNEILKNILISSISQKDKNLNISKIKKKEDGTIEEFDPNGIKFKEIDKNGNITLFKGSCYTVKDLKEMGYSFQDLKRSGYNISDLKEFYSIQELRDMGYFTDKDIEFMSLSEPEQYRIILEKSFFV